MAGHDTTSNRKENYLVSIFLIGILFFIFGFITWLNGTLIPYLKLACQLNVLESMLVAFAFYISYFVMAIPSSWMLKYTGFKKGMSLGLIVMALGALVFIPAAMTRTYALFLTGLFIMGTGLSLLQTASNPYVVILGPIESAAQRISIMGIANKVAGIISPIILGSVVLKGTDQIEKSLAGMDAQTMNLTLDALAHRVIVPYLIVTLSLLVLALFIRLSPLPEADTNHESGNDKPGTRTGIFQFPYLWLGVLAIFVYVGVEVIAADTIISYGKFWGIGIDRAKFFTSFTLGAMVVGYIIGIITIPKYIKQDKALALFTVFGVVFAALALMTTGFTSILFIALLGLANSIMWPAIWPLAIEGLGKFTKIGSALLIMGIAGGALLPVLYGFLADQMNNHFAYLILIPCYLYLLYFALKGHRIGKVLS